jgi:pimeloyl-ACP methyl ester carboxylesterase
MPRLVTTDGQSLHYYDVGPKAAPPVVVLHGFGMHGGQWLPLVLPFARRFRFLLPDLRGFGRSHLLTLGQRSAIGQHADDVHALLGSLDLRDVRLAGLSMGACTALELHARHGFDRVKSYLHIDQAPCITNDETWAHGLLGGDQAVRLVAWRELLRDLEPHRTRPLAEVAAPLRKRLCAIMAEFFGYAFHSPTARGLATLARHEVVLQRLVPTRNWSVLLDTMRSYLEEGYDWRASAASIPVPVTLHVGMASRMYPAEGQLWLASALQQAHVVRFEDCGHSVPFEAPGRSLRAWRDWLATA